MNKRALLFTVDFKVSISIPILCFPLWRSCQDFVKLFLLGQTHIGQRSRSLRTKTNVFPRLRQCLQTHHRFSDHAAPLQTVRGSEKAALGSPRTSTKSSPYILTTCLVCILSCRWNFSWWTLTSCLVFLLVILNPIALPSLGWSQTWTCN